MYKYQVPTEKQLTELHVAGEDGLVPALELRANRQGRRYSSRYFGDTLSDSSRLTLALSLRGGASAITSKAVTGWISWGREADASSPDHCWFGACTSTVQDRGSDCGSRSVAGSGRRHWRGMVRGQRYTK